MSKASVEKGKIIVIDHTKSTEFLRPLLGRGRPLCLIISRSKMSKNSAEQKDKTFQNSINLRQSRRDISTRFSWFGVVTSRIRKSLQDLLVRGIPSKIGQLEAKLFQDSYWVKLSEGAQEVNIHEMANSELCGSYILGHTILRSLYGKAVS